MKAVTFEGKRFVQTRDVPEPQIQEPNDLIIQTRQTAICGSDLHIYLEHELGNDYGTIMGHEFLGEVVEIGRNVKKLKVGDIIVSPFTTNCGDCFFCQNGLTCRCIHSQLFGWMNNKKGLPGAQAAYVRLPFADASALKLPQHIDEESALLLGDVLATGFLKKIKFNRDVLAQSIFFLPTQRSAANFARCITNLFGNKTVILPTIRPLGDITDEELFFENYDDRPNLEAISQKKSHFTT